MRVFKTVVVAVLIICISAAIGIDLLIRRGFRATSNPSALEVAVARRIRNFAIPSAERDQKNPVPATSTSLQRGHDLFVNRCAGCHGIDGGGRTPIGSNAYPRVPDLRAPAAQSLTDGQIYYIIENGVQLTGMPALGGNGSSADPWYLVLYVRGLRGLNPNEQSRVAASLSSAHYTGSQS
ncbi:MAG: c-type cytochrome, partial [Burkholderiales bacterium]